MGYVVMCEASPGMGIKSRKLKAARLGFVPRLGEDLWHPAVLTPARATGQAPQRK